MDHREAERRAVPEGAAPLKILAYPMGFAVAAAAHLLSYSIVPAELP